MKTLINILVLGFIASLLGCDKPLVLDQEDNVVAIELTAHEENGKMSLSWTRIDNAGFEKYWLVKVADQNTLLRDSITTSNALILHADSVSQNNHFVHNNILPTLNTPFYQVYALVGGRLVASNTVRSNRSMQELKGGLYGDLITGDEHHLYYVIKSLPDSARNYLIKQNIQTGKEERRIEVDPDIRLLQLLNPNTGTANAELVYTLGGSGGSRIYFLDAESLTLKHIEEFENQVINNFAILPTGHVAVLYDLRSKLQTFKRGTSTRGEVFPLENPTGSLSGIMAVLPEREEIVLLMRKDFRYRLGFDQSGNFWPVFTLTNQGPLAGGVSERTAVDPREEYLMSFSHGDVFSVDNLSLAHRLPMDSVNRFAFLWGFGGSGDYFYQIGTRTPHRFFMYDRHNFEPIFDEAVSTPLGRLQATFRIANTSYLVMYDDAYSPNSILLKLPQ